MTALKLHPAQTAVYEDETRFRVASAGRGAGKTELGVACIVGRARLGLRCAWVSLTYGNAAPVFHNIVEQAGNAVAKISKTNMPIEFTSGGEVRFQSARNIDTLRGSLPIDFVVLDEAAMMKPRVWFEVIRPSLLLSGGSALFLSTPFGRNWFWELWQRGRDRSDPKWRSWVFSTEDNPDVTAEKIGFLRQDAPQRIWDEQYRGMFVNEVKNQ